MSIAALVMRGVGPDASIPFLLTDGLSVGSAPPTSLAASPTTLSADTTGDVVTLTGTGTSWTPGGSGFAASIASLVMRGVGPAASIPLLLTDGLGNSSGGGSGSPIFTLTSTGTGAAITAQQVLSATSATVTVNAGTVGTITLTDPSTGDTAQIQVTGVTPPPAFLIGFNPWPSILPPFYGAGITGSLVSAFPGSQPVTGGSFTFPNQPFPGNLLVVFFGDGTTRVHLAVPDYLVQGMFLGFQPNTNFYNKYIRLAYPQATTQISSATTANSVLLPVATSAGILEGDSLIIQPLEGAPFYRTVAAVALNLVTLDRPIPISLMAGGFVTDINNQT